MTDTTNDFILAAQADVIAPMLPPVFRTKQAAWRFIAYLECMAEVLPDETPANTFEEVRQAIRNT